LLPYTTFFLATLKLNVIGTIHGAGNFFIFLKKFLIHFYLDAILFNIPWTIPGLLLSDGFLSPISILTLAITGITGFAGTVAWWRFAELG
jgi:hypothetical protein